MPTSVRLARSRTVKRTARPASQSDAHASVKRWLAAGSELNGTHGSHCPRCSRDPSTASQSSDASLDSTGVKINRGVSTGCARISSRGGTTRMEGTWAPEYADDRSPWLLAECPSAEEFGVAGFRI